MRKANNSVHKETFTTRQPPGNIVKAVTLTKNDHPKVKIKAIT